MLFGRLGGFPFHVLRAQAFCPLRLNGEHIPGCLGTAATLAHMVERGRFRLVPRLLGAGEIEVQVRASNDRSGQAILPVGRSQLPPGRLPAVRRSLPPELIPRPAASSRRSSCRDCPAEGRS